MHENIVTFANLSANTYNNTSLNSGGGPNGQGNNEGSNGQGNVSTTLPFTATIDRQALDPVLLHQPTPHRQIIENPSLALRTPCNQTVQWRDITLKDTTAEKFAGYRQIPKPLESRLGDGFYSDFITKMVTIKKAYALANQRAGRFSSPEIAPAIVKACDDIIKNPEKYAPFLWVPVYSGGCRTTYNMNINGVIAAAANDNYEKLGDQERITINANDHVNCGQSTNDTIPSAFILTLSDQIGELNQMLDTVMSQLSTQQAALREPIQQLIEAGNRLQAAGQSNLPLLATAAGTGATAHGLEPHLYPVLNQLLPEREIRPHNNLANATVDCSWYVKVENHFANCADLLTLLVDQLETTRPDMQFLLDQVRYVGRSVVKTANENGGALNLNFMDPQFDWTLMFDFQRLTQVVNALTHLSDPNNRTNSRTDNRADTDNEAIGRLVRALPSQLHAQAVYMLQSVDAAIEAATQFAQRTEGEHWLLFTELQPAVIGRVSDSLRGYAKEFDRQIPALPDILQRFDQFELNRQALSQGLSFTDKSEFAAYLDQLDLLLASFERTAKDFSLRSYQGGIKLETVAPGSSIMPGKVNPVICEMVQMLANQASAQIHLLKEKVTRLNAQPSLDNLRLSTYQLESIHRCVTTAAECVVRIMRSTELMPVLIDHYIQTSGALTTRFRGQRTESGAIVDYAIASALGKDLQGQRALKPGTTFSSMLGEAGRLYMNAQNERILITRKDVNEWIKGDLVGGIDPTAIRTHVALNER